MTEEEPRARLTPEDLGAVPAHGFEEIGGPFPAHRCAHSVLLQVRDDWQYLGMACEVATCLMCGQTLARFESLDEDDPSS